MVRIGCSGWSYQHWKGRFYPGRAPESGWLGLYAEMFDTVEVNATFYRLPLRSTVAGWAARTPRTFLFAVKASRYLTHVKRLRDLPAGLARLEERIAPLREADKLGPVLWQLPASFRRDDVRLAETLARLPDGRHAFEFRHPSWFDDDVYALRREHRAAIFVADRDGLPEAPWVDTAGWWYVRLHHGRAGRRGNYSPAELERWAERLRGRSGDAYVYFNNDWEGFAPQNAATLRSLVADR
jgi:uncharacterized protein YecE (DUF72 family)